MILCHTSIGRWSYILCTNSTQPMSYNFIQLRNVTHLSPCGIIDVFKPGVIRWVNDDAEQTDVCRNYPLSLLEPTNINAQILNHVDCLRNCETIYSVLQCNVAHIRNLITFSSKNVCWITTGGAEFGKLNTRLVQGSDGGWRLEVSATSPAGNKKLSARAFCSNIQYSLFSRRFCSSAVLSRRDVTAWPFYDGVFFEGLCWVTASL